MRQAWVHWYNMSKWSVSVERGTSGEARGQDAASVCGYTSTLRANIQECKALPLFIDWKIRLGNSGL
jgi:hypothetical protein